MFNSDNMYILPQWELHLSFQPLMDKKEVVKTSLDPKIKRLKRYQKLEENSCN